MESLCGENTGPTALTFAPPWIPLGRIDDVGRVAEVDNELLRFGQIALDLLAEGQLERGIPLRLKL